MQPTLTQVPPSSAASARPTRAPVCAAMRAARTPPLPPPMTKRSKSNVRMKGSLAADCSGGPKAALSAGLRKTAAGTQRRRRALAATLDPEAASGIPLSASGHAEVHRHRRRCRGPVVRERHMGMLERLFGATAGRGTAAAMAAAITAREAATGTAAACRQGEAMPAPHAAPSTHRARASASNAAARWRRPPAASAAPRCRPARGSVPSAGSRARPRRAAEPQGGVDELGEVQRRLRSSCCCAGEAPCCCCCCIARSCASCA